MLGTAFAQPGVLLVEQPGPWGHAGLTESHFDTGVARALESRARDAGLRVLAIRRPGAHADRVGPRCWAVLPASPPAETRVPRAVAWSSFTADAELLDAPLDGSTGEPDAEPLYLVCAHSKRDVCCALRGRPLAAELDTLRPGRIWECSHTGGHRFAPIVLALPIGALYGRVPDGGAADLVAATERGEVIPHRLRGLIGHAPVAQVALGALLAHGGWTSPSAVAVTASTEAEPGRWRVELRAPDGRWRAEIAVESVPTPYASCAKPTAGPQPRYTLLELSNYGER